MAVPAAPRVASRCVTLRHGGRLSLTCADIYIFIYVRDRPSLSSILPGQYIELLRSMLRGLLSVGIDPVLRLCIGRSTSGLSTGASLSLFIER